MKRLILILLIVALLVIGGCSNQQKEDDIVQTEEEQETEVSIIPNSSLTDAQYKILLPYRPSAARGAITNQVTNRVDMDELEEGLRRHSVDVYDPKKYLFEEGQYLSTEFIYEMIDDMNPAVSEKGSKEDKIKENRNNPRVFSHILEQNFLQKKDDDSVELVGLSIGISLKSVYRFQVEPGGPNYYEKIPKPEMMKEGKKIAQEVLKEIRQQEGLEDVNVMIGLFREEEQSSPVPGNFVAKTVVGQGENEIGKWEEIQEEHILFPSENGKDKYYDDHQKVKTFSDRIAEYFPNYVGVAGEGFYIDQNLTRLTLEVPLEFYGKGEVIGFTQYTYGLVKEIFPNHYDIEVSITSSDGTESLIYRPAGEDEPDVHIYH